MENEVIIPEYEDIDTNQRDEFGCVPALSFYVVAISLVLFILKWVGAIEITTLQCFIPFLVLSVPLFSFGFISKIIDFVQYVKVFFSR